MIEPPEVPHAPHSDHGKEPAKWLDKVMAISVLLMSMGSLYVALHTGAAMDKLVANNEKLVKAQSTPLLQYFSSNLGGPNGNVPELSFTVANVGTGPARVVWVRVMDGDKQFPGVRPWLLSQTADGKTLPPQVNWVSSDIDGTLMPVGEKRVTLSWQAPAAQHPEALALWEKVDLSRAKINLQACYCSLFDECWISPMDASIPKPVPQCTASDAKR